MKNMNDVFNMTLRKTIQYKNKFSETEIIFINEMPPSSWIIERHVRWNIEIMLCKNEFLAINTIQFRSGN